MRVDAVALPARDPEREQVLADVEELATLARHGHVFAALAPVTALVRR